MRSIPLLILLLAIGAGPLDVAAPAPPPASPSDDGRNEPEDEELDRAGELIAKGLDALAKARNPDGSISDPESERIRIALTSLALLAFLADGNSETRGPYAEIVRDAVKFLLSCARRDGPERGCFLAAGDVESRMHGHGFAVIALCQVMGHHGVGRKFAGTALELREVVSAAVDVILQSQNSAGGWGYQPLASMEDEGSITVCMIQALRAARNVGIAVPKRAIDRALDYVKASQNPDGSIRYSVRNRRAGSYELTAAGVSVLAYGGEYSSSALRAARDYMRRQEEALGEGLVYPLYGRFYAAQALWFDRRGDEVQRWFPTYVDWFEQRWQEKEKRYRIGARDRSKEAGYGPAYAAAMATLTLQVTRWSLPLFDR